ncbi:Cellulose synthase catalytic subunit [UDP-forming] [Aureliella helgolandensis]|uniref:Cellulose synthase catalytic subunit [UDP-forming] n=2 Tax=Aureliella helgolandensis TaxID=2527968 RepID=A0A518G3T4_9BACT|nr:Cellulose synthase catalytic subunit [UDP-forming] [Aureliella helgolandensis]
MILAVIATFIYISYRAFTLNLDGWYASFASISLYLAEIYGCGLMFLYFFQIWEIVEPEAVPPLDDRSVDVFIPTYNEDPELLRGTISAAISLDYPHKTYVLDDGNRAEVAALAMELGALYINRETNLHAKAGNLNHAMEITHGEFVVIFDADHVSRRDFITRLLGYFSDDKMGFVQTPHSFYNFDNFHGILDYKKQQYWEEGELFYNVIQPGKNYWNAVSFCGSAAMFRRSALEDVGLVATETITEDMHTGLRMHARGWKSLFVNERMVSGQAATDVTTFNTQRLRWGEGNLGVFAYDNPITMPGLTLAQRLGYVGSMLSWTTGIQKLQLYIAPMLMLLTGVPPVAELSWTLGIITVVYMMTIWTAVKITGNGHGHLMGTELTHMASFWTQIVSTYRAIFKRKKTTFVVTSKRGRQTNRIRKFILPQCLYIAGSALSIAWASTMYSVGLSHDLNGLIVGSILLLIQSWFAWQVIRRALRMMDEVGRAWRHPCAVNVEYTYVDEEGGSHTGHGVSCDLNEQGLGFHAFEVIPNEHEVEVVISAMGVAAHCRGKIHYKSQMIKSVSRRDGNVQSWRYGLQFIEPSSACLASVWRLCSDYATARMYDQFEARKRHKSTDSIERVLVNSTFAEQRVNLPLVLQLPDGERISTVTEGLSPNGCMFLIDRSPAVGQELNLELITPLGVVTSTATVTGIKQVCLGATALEFPELQFGKFVAESRSLLLSLCTASKQNAIAQVVTLRPPEKRLPNARPAILTGLTSLAAAILAIVFTLSWHRDALLISRASHSTQVSPGMRDKLAQMVNDLVNDPAADEARIVELHGILWQLKDKEGLAKLDELLLQREVETFSARLCRAQTLDNVRRYAEAERIYNLMMPVLDAPKNREHRQDLLLSAARNQANLNNTTAAIALLDQIDRTVLTKNSALRREYAGLLVEGDRPAQAIDLLAQNPHPELEELRMLGTIYSSLGEFPNAVAAYEQILASHEGGIETQVALAENAMWGKDYPLAISTFQEVLRQDATNHQALENIAFAFLWSGDGKRALDAWEQLLAKVPHRLDYQLAFAQSMQLVGSGFTEQQIDLVKFIAGEVVATPNNEMMTETLVNVLSQLGQPQLLMPLLTSLVERQPDRIKLRLQLVNLLKASGQFELADQHLEMLVSATSGVEAAPALRYVTTPAPGFERAQ